MKKYICPKCKSTRVYQEVSVVAKRNMNTRKVYDVNKDKFDNEFCETLDCDKCGHNDKWERFEKLN